MFLPLVARLIRVALSDDEDPTLGATIAAMHARKMAGDPEWAELLAAVPDFRARA